MGAKLVTKHHRTLGAMGHHFDEQLECGAVGCEATWLMHQLAPTDCAGVRREKHGYAGLAPEDRPDYTELVTALKAERIPFSHIAELVPCAPSQVHDAFRGAGRVSRERLDRIEVVARDMLAAKGVAFAEGAG